MHKESKLYLILYAFFILLIIIGFLIFSMFYTVLDKEAF